MILRLEFELTYFKAAVKHFSYFRNSSNIFKHPKQTLIILFNDSNNNIFQYNYGFKYSISVLIILKDLFALLAGFVEYTDWFSAPPSVLDIYLPNPPLGQDMTQGQLLSGV